MSVFKTFVFTKTQPEDPFVSPPLGMYHVHISNLGKLEIVNSSDEIIHPNPVIHVNSGFTASTDSVLLANASAQTMVITLPLAENSVSTKITVKKIDSTANRVTIEPQGAETIDGASTLELSIPNLSATIVCDGFNWYVI